VHHASIITGFQLFLEQEIKIFKKGSQPLVPDQQIRVPIPELSFLDRVQDSSTVPLQHVK
jgi:hypothetical protein